MAQIFNHIKDTVQQSIDALVKIYPNLKQLEKTTALYDQNQSSNLVPIISGGGSGHEPAHFGFIGQGMLSGAICGPIFIPPKAEDIFKLIRFLDKGNGVFIIIKNFEADLKEFSKAIQMAKNENIKVAYIISHDDVSVDKNGFTPRHRGVAGTIFLHKLLGYLSQKGATIEEIEKSALSISANIATLGVATSSVLNPITKKNMFQLDDDQISYGIGIHGESGYKTENIHSSELLANKLINKLHIHFKCKKGDRFALLINNLGATSKLEELVFTNDILQLLDLEGVKVKFVKTGHYMTCLNMGGLSVTLMPIKEDWWLEALEAPTLAPSW